MGQFPFLCRYEPGLVSYEYVFDGLIERGGDLEGRHADAAERCVISMSVLSVLAGTRRWTPWLLFWGTAGSALALVVGAAVSGPVVWLALGVLPMLWALTFGVVLLIRGTFEPHPTAR